ncbi:uncharacterized protein TNCV_3450721 [Trichonephila clavipes]|uniref:Mutator-like transposase domain-containing protein n=1 Tax=Trichonephila clavipes TaxID=2585209 RepID=A0A8X6WJX3_TRICX|nr:uncharacterized protein TNCV_3450721 [Trichonephila clavipes]
MMLQDARSKPYTENKPYLRSSAKRAPDIAEYRIEVLIQSTEKSLKDVRSQVKSTYQSNSAIIDIYVTFDGTWLTRGHSSQIRVVCVIDLLTGFVMDFEIMSKRCIECEHAKSGMGENSVEFHVWYEGHISSCTIKHVGSSCAMEQEVALKLWQRSEDTVFDTRHYCQMVMQNHINI